MSVFEFHAILHYQKFSERLHKMSYKIEICEDDKASLYEQEVNEILSVMGMDEALVTDESQFYDFMSIEYWRYERDPSVIDEAEKQTVLDQNQQLLLTVSLLTGVAVSGDMKVADVAQLYHLNKKSKTLH